MTEDRTPQFFDWIRRLTANHDCDAVTNRLTSSAVTTYTGDTPKAVVAFDEAPDDLLTAVNDTHVRVLDTQLSTRDGEVAVAVRLEPTKQFSRPAEHGFEPVEG